MSSSTITSERMSTFTNFHRPAITATEQAPQQSSTRVFADDPFRARFGHKLPIGLRKEARGMQWRTFVNTYAPAADVRINLTDTQRLRGAYNRYTVEITKTTTAGREVETTEIIASGAMQAASNLLADRGRRVEIYSFHQFEIFEATVTFVYAGDNNKKHWAMGFGGTREQSMFAAMNSASQLIHG